MDSLAAAAGLRPPTGPFGLLWLHIAAPICRTFGVPTACTVLRIAGHVALGVNAVLSAAIFSMLLPTGLRRGEHLAAWWRRAVRFVLFQGVLLFCFADPVWNAYRWFSPLSLQLMVAMLATMLFVAHFRFARRAPLVAAFALVGLLAADTPVGFLLLVAAVSGLGVRRYLRSIGAVTTPAESPFASAFAAWRLTQGFFLGFIAGVALEAGAFASANGPAAFGWTWGDYALEMPFAYIRTLFALCSPVGYGLFLAVAVVPAVVVHRLAWRSSDPERPLRYAYGFALTCFGFAMLFQLGGAKVLWFWTWAGGCVRDGFVRCIAMFLCALSAVWILSVFMMELYMRNFRRIATQRLADSAEEVVATTSLAFACRMQRIVRVVFLFEPLLVFAFILPFRAQVAERTMLDIVWTAVKEAADECRDVDFLFTDGGLDAYVELAAAADGHELRALSMMGGAMNRRDVYLRTRGVDDPADKALLESGAADALRIWMRTQPEKLRRVAVQIGFELWRRDGRPMPECSGLVARPEGLSPAAAALGAAAGRRIAERILAFYGSRSPDAVTDRPLKDAFLFTQWRLAVLARHRANAYDERGEKELAIEETRLADELDKNNGALARIRANVAWANRWKLERMTPQEGLNVGLSRADFALARVFALQVLDVSPDDPAANFALGMDFFVQKQYSRAEVHLARCLDRRPDDPAVLNNLAQCRLRQGDAQGALPYAKRALELLPDSPAVKLTMDRVTAAMSAPSAAPARP